MVQHFNKIFENYPLASYNTFHFPVNARFFASFATIEQLRELLSFTQFKKLPFFVLGGGANVLFSKNYDGIIIHPVSQIISIDGDILIADAGVKWDSLVDIAVEKGLGGLENLSYIPGSVGASVVQNIGAYGAEAKDSVLWVEYMSAEDLQLYKISKTECHFGYRDSIFKHELKDKAIITRVAYKLQKESYNYPYNIDYGLLKSKVRDNLSIRNIRNAVIEIRSSKLPDPDVLGNAGSFFRNPEIDAVQHDLLKARFPEIISFPLENGKYKISAGWLIEKAGWKGRSLGNAAVHDKQALVLVNTGNATGEEVIKLSESIKIDVYKTFGIELCPEVIFL